MKTYQARSDRSRGQHKFCLITAKSDELREVKKVLGSTFSRQDGEELGPTVYKVKDSATGGVPTTLLATCCTAMGNVHAATKTAQVIQRYRPSVLLFVGTAASLNPKKIRLGDVVIPSRSSWHFYDKIVQKGQRDYDERANAPGCREKFFDTCLLVKDSRDEDIPSVALDVLADVHFEPMNSMLRDKDLPPKWITELGVSRAPKIDTDTEIVTCGMVVNSADYRDYLLGAAKRKSASIDMESFGFFRAVNDMVSDDVAMSAGIMIRGISDYAGEKEQTEADQAAKGGQKSKSGSWKDLAMENAAIVAAQIVSSLSKS